MKVKNKAPKSSKAWLMEISEAYIYAMETLPFAELKGDDLIQKDIFHMAPVDKGASN